MALFSFLDREHSIAKKGYNRWLVPPAALAIHLCIGQIYAYSVFNRPMTQIIGISESANSDWKLTSLGWIFSIALFTLGASAALFGKWLERVGPRKAMFASALCFSGGFFIAALGVHLHQLWLIYLGHGVIGGIGLGLGYISPVSTLIKWFPDRPGMATGMAIMGFGGGAMIASPLSVSLMETFQSASSTGVAQTFLVMGAIYFCFMMFGVFTIRVPVKNWKPVGWVASLTKKNQISRYNYVDADAAIRTPQFYLLFGVLMLNVTAGIGVLGSSIRNDPGNVFNRICWRKISRFSRGRQWICWAFKSIQYGGKISLVLAFRSHRTKTHLQCILSTRSIAVCIDPQYWEYW